MQRYAVVVVFASCTSSELPPDEDVVLDVVTIDDIQLAVPAPGETVGIVAHELDGTVHELAIESRVDGSFAIVEPDRVDTDAVQVLAASAACSDGAYALEGFHWASNYTWSYQASSTPAANSAANVEAGLRVGASAITTQRNDCGFADQVSATHTYAGTTTRGPNIPNSTSTISCGTRDNHNVVGFGVLPATYLAVTCYWYSNKVALEADVKFNKNHHWFAQAVPSGCSNSFGIEQVSTHELGHAFGLAHVAQAAHASQTMSPISFPCTNVKVTLGRGDVRGLRALY